MRAADDALLGRIRPEPLVEMLVDMVRLRSQNPGEDERAVAAYVADRCRALGLATEVLDALPGRPNVIARLRGARPGPVVVLNTHTDTVPASGGWTVDPFGGEIRQGRVYGLGAADAKGQAAAMLGAIEALVAAKTPLAGELVLTAVADEEMGSRGSRAVVKGLKADYAVVGEPTRMRVAIAHRGSVRPRIVVHGKSAHSSMPKLGLNAVFKMRKVLEALERYVDGLDAIRHPLIGHATGAVTLIKGGHKESAVPDRCEVVLDRRMVPGESQDQVVKDIERVLAEAAAADPALKVTIEGYLPVSGPPSETPRDARIVNEAVAAVAEATGTAPEVYGASFGCDMTHFRAIGAEAVVVGPGDIDRAHSADEWLGVDELADGARAYAALLRRLLA
jgi:acetylornithine deacetylase/succinyl-diaminopimelate desuccinylase family protein